jgi:predicted nucleic-acid-binding Zn-ribbon protein
MRYTCSICGNTNFKKHEVVKLVAVFGAFMRIECKKCRYTGRKK